MHSSQSNRGSAFTLIELLMVIAIIAMLAAMLLPALNQGTQRAKQIQCVDHLRETGLGFHMFMHDHNSKFPMQVSTNEGGSLEFVQSSYHVGGDFYYSFRHFQSLSKELVTPKLLVCPSDLARWPATNFAEFKNENVSYFVGVNAEFAKPDSILAGDRNISDPASGSSTILHANLNNTLRWTAELHRYRGNVLYSDGHVEQQKSLQADSGDIILPTVPPITAAQNPGGGGTSGGSPSQGPSAGQPSAPNKNQSDKKGADADVPKAGENAGEKKPGSSGQSTSMRVAVTPTAVTSPTQTVFAPNPDTNPVPLISVNQPQAAEPASEASPFAQWVAEFADELVHWAVWLLYALLLLMVLAAVILKLRQHSRRKQRPND